MTLTERLDEHHWDGFVVSVSRAVQMRPSPRRRARATRFRAIPPRAVESRRAPRSRDDATAEVEEVGCVRATCRANAPV